MRAYLAPLIENPGVLSITVMPANSKISGKARMAAKNKPGYTATWIKIK